ncbi:MAG: uroporphyrinogen decarboxylase family protein [Sedimentisphaerales bacterium]
MLKMNSKERIISAVKYQEVDYIPLGQLFHSTILKTPDEKKWKNQFERAMVMKELGLDPVIDIWMPAPEAPPDIPVKKWMENDTDSEDKLLCAAYETPAGTLTAKVRRTDADWYHHTHYRFLPKWDGNAHRDIDQFDRIDMMDDFFTRRYRVPLVKGPNDLDAFAYLLKAPTGGYRDLWIQQAKQAKRMANELGLATQARRVSVGDWFMWVCWIEDFCMDMVARPEYVSRFYGIINDYNKQIVEMVLEADVADIIQYRGWYDTPDYWGTKRYSEILEPRISELCRQVHDADKLFCVLLTEGYTLYKDILSMMDVDVYLGLEPLAARKSEDLAVVKKTLQRNKRCIWGGVNACVTVGMGTDEEIETSVKTAIEKLGPRGFILNAAMYIYDDDATWDRFMVFVNSWKKYRNINKG